MSANLREQLWQRLRENSLVEGDVPPAPVSLSPWHVRVMLGAAGWIGALFLLGFVGTGFAFVMHGTVAALIIGILVSVAAFVIFRTVRDNDFAMQFGLAISLVGQGIFIAGLSNGFGFRTSLMYFSIFLFETILAVFVPNFIHRILTSTIAAFALSLALSNAGMPGVAPGLVAAGFAMIWLNQQRLLANNGLWRPIGYGMALALLLIANTRLFGLDFVLGRTASGMVGWYNGYWLDTILMTVVMVWSVTRILVHEQIVLSSKPGIAAIIAAIVIGSLSMLAPGISAALLILLLGFASGNRILIGLGIFALAGFVMHYYYQLQTTLLMKSIILAANGVVLLLVRLLWHKAFKSEVTEALNE